MAHILIVDDEPSVVRCIRRTLERAGHTTGGATSGEAGRALLREMEFDLAIADYSMPEETGVSFLESARSLQPLCARILMSGRLTLPVAVEAVNSGEITRLLPKPFTPVALEAVVGEAMLMREKVIELADYARQARVRAERRGLDLVSQRGVELALQPIVSMPERRTRAFEALVRCRDGLFKNPEEVFGAALREGRLMEITDLVLGHAALISRYLPSSYMLFINLHPEDLRNPDLLAEQLSVLKLDAGRVVLEVTERSRLEDMPRWQESVSNARDAGFKLAIDDLGSGFNSLSLVASLSPEFIKLDMSLVRGVHLVATKQRLVEMVVRFADASGASVIAEGVEQEEEAGALLTSGVTLMQGYLFGRPIVRRPEAWQDGAFGLDSLADPGPGPSFLAGGPADK